MAEREIPEEIIELMKQKWKEMSSSTSTDMNSLTLKGGNIHHITGVKTALAIVAVGTCGYANTAG